MREALELHPRSARPTSRSRARCTATPRCRRRSACAVFPRLAAARRGEPAHHADARRRQHLLQPAEDRRRRRRHDRARSCSARRAPVHILTPSATVRRIVNMTALAVADANAPRGQEQTLVLMETAASNVAPFPASRMQAARGAGAHRRRRARRLPGRAWSRRCATSSASPTKNPFPILCGTSAGAINAADARRRSPTTSRAAVANLLEVWEHMHCHHIYRTDAWHIMKSGARWLARDDAGLAPQPGLAARQRAAARHAAGEPATSSGSRRTSIRARCTRCASPPRATPPARACRSSRAAAASRAGSATSASARRSR